LGSGTTGVIHSPSVRTIRVNRRGIGAVSRVTTRDGHSAAGHRVAQRVNTHSVDVVVIGAGQAGLSAAYHLRRTGFAPGDGFVVLDGDDGPGGAWRHRWPTLRRERGHGCHGLPGMPLPRADPQRPA